MLFESCGGKLAASSRAYYKVEAKKDCNSIQTTAVSIARESVSRGTAQIKAEAESIRVSLLIGKTAGKEHAVVLKSLDQVIIPYEIQ